MAYYDFQRYLNASKISSWRQGAPLRVLEAISRMLEGSRVFWTDKIDDDQCLRLLAKRFAKEPNVSHKALSSLTTPYR